MSTGIILMLTADVLVAVALVRFFSAEGTRRTEGSSVDTIEDTVTTTPVGPASR